MTGAAAPAMTINGATSVRYDNPVQVFPRVLDDNVSPVQSRRGDNAPEVFEAAFDETQSNVFSKALETFFTLSVIFSTALMPFVLLQILAPAFMSAVMSSVFVWALVPYVLVMVVLGLKISSLFGCSAWSRIAAGWQGER